MADKVDAKTEGKFELIKKTNFEQLVEGQVMDLPESDLCFQNEKHILQFKYIRPEEDKKFEVKPGIYTLSMTNVGVCPQKTDFVHKNLLDTVDNTKQILKEARTFFSRLEVYEKLNRPKKRAVLLASKPGLGKTSAIAKLSHEFVKEDPGTVIFNWPTSEIEPEHVSKFLSTASEYTKDCTRLVLIIEDIGGGERENEGHSSGVTSGLLNLLDGVDVTFKLPTFILATTNFPENLLESLADRPGRFGLMIELQPPTLEERIALLEFIAHRKITKTEKEALSIKGAEKFSIAHLEEVVVRSMLHDKTIPAVIRELIEHTERYANKFEKPKGHSGLARYNND